MDTLLSMRVFRQVAEGGSFADAARRMGLSAAMASKHVAHLERHLGSRLLNRSSRHVSLTEAGAVYLDHCADALDRLDEAESTLGRSGAEPSGTLKITAPVWCANARFAAMLARYRQRYPRVVMDLRLTNHKIDLAEGGFDVALRATNQDLPSLIVRPLCQLHFFLVASPDYLARHARITTPSDLTAHDSVLPSYLPSAQRMTLAGPEGTTTVQLKAAMKSDDSTLTHQSILAGIGIGYLPEWQIADDLATGALQRVLPAYSAVSVTLYAAYTSRKFLSPKVRTFIDFFSEAFGRPPA
ncbi:LysR family transcriptional regulator [Pigmentiphaga litoralis]|uniref:DNA-binding transcriptional LysR family regulator n=1 Tax=Pigmentiphaga litoralis TaxID=516702 RepID=A0A7Y9LIN6_9BURK|nr:LysR family transcriptional regulator [Pigmentiphaga litoralis]NYE25253.1 DNA-binding transcriptional LysR family regulator [Pigmentiphaga litoralis]NYE81134.1 DNA-binding transcriptional LysR family regulator [Pigmentiphaga litoralis]